ncbi:L-threonylcarbamoyladenylate synthase [Chlamydiifrater phoenicopteri]|uniref:L-threonylcarbamoyladenylate synthase n=1 Tax=Chlamydiifrater phoenicopteri TaxID=2681469 RepID=UPI001BCB4D69|nr:L-threonylcarbamoyladenylate synthase [Chlamydiifrater phoenicopteri]
MKTKLIASTPENIEAAAKVLEEGGIVAFPTETVYGLGASASATQKTINQIYSLKKRSLTKPLGIYLGSKEEALNYLPSKLLDIFQKLAMKFLPGPLTIVFPDKNTGISVAIRISNNPILSHLLHILKHPILGTSANRSNLPSAVKPQEVLSDFPEGLHIILDGGSCSLGIESTVISIDPLVILRQGVIPKESLEEALATSIPIQASNSSNKSKESFGISIRVFDNFQDIHTYVNSQPPIPRKIYSNFLTKDYYSLIREALTLQCKEVIFLYPKDPSSFFPPLSRKIHPDRFTTEAP